MTANRLTALSIESDVVRRISFDDIVDDFAAKNRASVSVICKLVMQLLANLMTVDMTVTEHVSALSAQSICC